MEVACGLVNSYAETDAINVVQAAISSGSILKMLWPIIDDIKVCFSKVAGGIICCHVVILTFLSFEEIYDLDAISVSIEYIVLGDRIS